MIELQTRSATVQGVEIPVRADFDRMSPERPLVVVIRGFRPPDRKIEQLTGYRPGVDFAYFDLPGMMGTPHLPDHGLEPFGVAIEAACTAIFPGRRPFLVGVSLGGVAALAFRSCAGALLIDTPLTTGRLWPLITFTRQLMVDEPDLEAWCWRVLGIGRDTIVNRDYRGLLTGFQAPAIALIGETPLEPPRPFETMPSLVTDEDRQLYSRHVRTVIIPNAGHAIPAQAPQAIVAGVDRLLELGLPGPTAP